MIVLFCAALLLFVNLGHYALWDDEANTALIAEGIWATGDTSAIVGHNLVAYEGGWELKHLKERYIPPLPAYLTAASFALFGESSLKARIPFALCGVGFFVVVLWWLFYENADRWTWGLIIFALLTNVSLILYFRQARYYGIVMFLSTLLAYLYLHWSGTWQRQLLIVLLAIALLASNYISFGAAALCVAIDWCIWGRKTVRLDWKKTAASIGGIATAGTALLCIFNPFNTSQPPEPHVEGNIFLHLFWNLRDLSINEFCILPLLALVPLVGWWKRDVWLLRGSTTLAIYFVAIGIVEPHHSAFAQLRFMATAIPLSCVLEVRTVLLLAGNRKWLTLLCVPILGTNVLSGNLLFSAGASIPLRCTFYSFLGELADPPADPYREASDWINANLPPDATILALPQYASYPLMFHAPRQIYGWQLDDPPRAQFANLPDIQFKGRVAPSYLVIFGPEGMSEYQPIKLRNGTKVNYSPLKTLPVLGKDLFRPELYARVFSAPSVNLHGKAVYILQKQ
jgi:4-amino-4-deoxy-L-arabinose transferase-like glycosyltransferase